MLNDGKFLFWWNGSYTKTSFRKLSVSFRRPRFCCCCCCCGYSCCVVAVVVVIVASTGDVKTDEARNFATVPLFVICNRRVNKKYRDENVHVSQISGKLTFGHFCSRLNSDKWCGYFYFPLRPKTYMLFLTGMGGWGGEEAEQKYAPKNRACI